MSGLRVSPAQLTALSGSVTRVAESVLAEHQSLKSQLTPLFGADWSGTASARFAELYEQFDLHARGMSDALAGIGRLLAGAGTAYADVEQQIAASFR